MRADGLEHAVEVDRAPVEMAGQHRPAADHDGGHVEAHGGHEHAGHDLVADGTSTRASKACAMVMDSTVSAMSSRLGSE